MASLERSLHGDEILWVDYDAGVALHRGDRHRASRAPPAAAGQPVAADHRITYGCINVPAKFFDARGGAAVSRGAGIVYVLPETRSARATFGLPDAAPEPPDEAREQERLACPPPCVGATQPRH